MRDLLQAATTQMREPLFPWKLGCEQFCQEIHGRISLVAALDTTQLVNDALAQTLAEDSTLKDALKRSSLLFFSAEQHDVAPILYRIPLVALSPLAVLLLSQKDPSLKLGLLKKENVISSVRQQGDSGEAC